jgi:hypothetical protein
MRNVISIAAASMAVMGAALAQVQVGGGVVLLDVSSARYSDPAEGRLSLQVDDQPRLVALGDKDEICVQLRRESSDSTAISAHVRALRPEPQAAAVVQVAGPTVSPGTYRSTPWGMLLRVVSDVDGKPGNVRATANAPVCVL